MWNSGRVGMMEVYPTDNMLTRVNPDLMGIAPVPAGPGGRASELNCPMAGIFSGAAKKGPEVLDAAWKYVHFLGSPEARAIRTRILVKNGYGMFASPEYLKKLGYKEYLRRVPETWRRTFREAMENGEPEPYGRNCQNVYTYTTWPADKMVIEGLGRHEFDAVEAARKHLTRERPDISEGDLQAELEAVRQRTRTEVRRKIKAILDEYAARANEKMIGEVPPAEMRKRRIVALIVVAAIAIAFLALFVYIAKVFTPKGVKGRWMFRKHWLAYLLLIPALATIALWRYIPMIRGAVIAFQDYHIVWDNMWVGLDNFANTLWDAEFWNALVLSVWYVILAIGLGFFAPIFLAILLHEVPKGKILFRTLYYLPAVLSGLVVMLMWKGFFEPSKRGLLNQVVTSVPPWLAFGVGALITLGFVAASCFYFRSHRKVGGWVTAVLAAAVGVGTVALGDWASASMAEQRWELAGVAALGAVVLAVNCRFAFRRGSRFWGWASLVAAVTMGVTIVLLWRWQWAALPAAAQRWLKDPRWAMFCVVLPTAWAGMGPGCLIYLAALKTIPEDLYEAADLDGAGFFSKAWHITVPMIKVLIIINFIGAVVNAFRVSGYILAMTGGGPAGATEVLALKIFFDAFVHLRFGMATATAWLMGAMLIGFTVFQMRRLSRVEFRTAGR